MHRSLQFRLINRFNGYTKSREALSINILKWCWEQTQKLFTDGLPRVYFEDDFPHNYLIFNSVIIWIIWFAIVQMVGEFHIIIMLCCTVYRTVQYTKLCCIQNCNVYRNVLYTDLYCIQNFTYSKLYCIQNSAVYRTVLYKKTVLYTELYYILSKTVLYSEHIMYIKW